MRIAIYCGLSSWVNICDRDYNLTKLDFNTVLDWVRNSGKGDYLIFGTDIIPYTLYNYPEKPIEETPLFSFLKKGGRVIWIGDVPLFYREKTRGTKEVIGESKTSGFIQEIVSPSPLPVSVSLINSPYLLKLRNTIVGDMLKYNQKESWRPIRFVGNIIPLNLTEDKRVSSWILPYGDGFFIRLFDSRYVDADYVISFPRLFEDMLNKIGLKINYRKFSNFNLILPKGKIYVIVGDNNVGKTSLLEAISLMDEKNNELVKNYRGTLPQSYYVEFFFKDFYYVDSQALGTSNLKRNNLQILLIYSRYINIENSVNKLYDPNLRVELQKTLTKEIRKILKDIDYIYIDRDGKIRALVKNADLDDRGLSELGEGYKEIINFLGLYTVANPEIILIDDLEAFALHPNLLQAFFKILFDLGKTTFITTQSIDVIYYADKVADELKVDDLYYVLLGDSCAKVISRKEFEENYNLDPRILATGVTNESCRG